MKIISLYSIKGGVGKTAACVNLAYLAAKTGFRTLLCDLDPQSAASYYFKIRPSKKFNSRRFLRGGKRITKNIKASDYSNLDLIPGNLSFRNLDLHLHNKKKSKRRLGEILSDLDSEFDVLFVDCPPNITLVSENVFRTSDLILVPLIPTTLSILTYDKLLKFFNTKRINSSKIVLFFSMIERRKKLHQQIAAEVVESTAKFFKTQIPYASEVEQMGIHRAPLVHYKPNSKTALAYKNLWDELNSLINTPLKNETSPAI